MEKREKFISPKLPKRRIRLAERYLEGMREKIKHEQSRRKPCQLNDELNQVKLLTNPLIH